VGGQVAQPQRLRLLDEQAEDAVPVRPAPIRSISSVVMPTVMNWDR
jgi:hypothetical protein